MRRFLWLAWWLSCLAAGPGLLLADDLEDAQAAYAAGDYSEALLLLRPLLLEGDAEAQYLYGRMLENGDGVERDLEQARAYYRRAARQGHAEAKARLQALTAQGEADGGGSDESVAVDWFREAAESGDPEAQFNYAHALETGWGTARDEKAARRWFRRAAEAGHDGAQLRLGLMLVAGAGGPADVSDGVRWIRRAARNGNPVAEALVQEVLDERGPLDDATVRLLTALRESVWDSDEAALQRLEDMLLAEAEAPAPPVRKVKAASSEAPRPASPPGQRETVHPPENVFAIDTRDPVRLRDWVAAYRQAAEAGEMEAQFALAVLYLQGRGVPRDRELGLRWMQRAAEQGYVPAASYLRLAGDEFGSTALRGSIILDWLKERALAWDPQAFYLLGRLFETGRGVRRDPEEARRWFQIAALMGVSRAMARHPEETPQAGAATSSRNAEGTSFFERIKGGSGVPSLTVTIMLASVLFLSGVGLLAWWLYRRRQRVQPPPVRRGALPRPTGRGQVVDEDLAFVRDLWGQEGGGAVIDVEPPRRASPGGEERPAATSDERPRPAPPRDEDERSPPSGEAPPPASHGGAQRRESPPEPAPPPPPPAAPRRAEEGAEVAERLPSDVLIPLSSADIEARNIARERRMRQRIDAESLLRDMPELARRRPASARPAVDPAPSVEAPDEPPAAAPEQEGAAPHEAAAPGAGPTSHEAPPSAQEAAQSLADVQFNIALMFANGDGVPKNPVLAAKWFEKAARQGHAEAQFRLGGLYWTGELGEKDPAKARSWLEQAAQNGHGRARELLDKIQGRRDQSGGAA